MPKTNNGVGVLPPRSAKELVQIAIDIVEERIFTTWDLPDNDVESFQMCFMVFAFMKRRDLNQLKKQAGLIFEYHSKRMPMACNGLPMFASAQVLNKGDTEIVRNLVREWEIARSRFLTAEHPDAHQTLPSRD